MSMDSEDISSSTGHEPNLHPVYTASSSASVTSTPAQPLIRNDKNKVQATVKVSPINSSDNIPDASRPVSLVESQPYGARRRDWKADLSHAFHRIIARIGTLNPASKEPESVKHGRVIKPDLAQQGHLIDLWTGQPYINNSIRSSKYTLWTFLPRQLWFQFSKLANFYFLCVSILQMIPGLSTTGTYTTIIPLSIFVCISMAKELWEDLRRHKLDKIENFSTAGVLIGDNKHISHVTSNALVLLLESHVYQSILWKDIRVGNIVCLRRDDAVPADLIVLQVCGNRRTAYVETAALDGETNLKTKYSPHWPAGYSQLVGSISEQLEITAEDPNLDLHEFNGNILQASERLPLTNDNILYRGSVLRNTDKVYGMVVYSGEECKIRMNANKTPRLKAPSLQSWVNRIVILLVSFVLALSLVLSICYEIWKPHERRWTYLDGISLGFITIFVTFVILLNTMIPLSLYVSLEVVKIFQIWTMMNDVEMYDGDSNTAMEARTSTINEELGQVTHIFSDKTGTLTQNSMVFRKLSVAGTSWLHRSGSTHQSDAAPSSQRVDKLKRPMTQESKASSTADQPDTPGEHGTTLQLLEFLRSNPQTKLAQDINRFILFIALCHTCIPESNEDGSVTYQATSPDEVALVKGAEDLGYVLVSKEADTVTIKTALGGTIHLEEYQVLHVLGFTSKRRRMSVIVRIPDGTVCIICKGADSTVAMLLKMSKLAKQTTDDIERKVLARKSIEAEDYLRRKSLQMRTSGRFSLERPPRPAHLSLNALATVHTNVVSGQWLGDDLNHITSSPIDTRFSSHSPLSPSFRPQHTSPNLHTFKDAMGFDERTVFSKCFTHIDAFATEGLRTLLYGYRYVGEAEYKEWEKTFIEASSSLDGRQGRIDDCADEIEQNFELLGCTAIEDKLQTGVPLAIERLRRADIKMWMLTGDKRETAINVGRSCNLIQDFSDVSIIDVEAGSLPQQMASAKLSVTGSGIAHSVVVIDGHTLSFIENNPTMHGEFIDLAVLADCVVCCRASPAQKASLVRYIRHKFKAAVTLAIGDGSNDIAMIQEAHVGIGITGKEGLQAARVSDYSIAQFRFLVRLLLIHGHWNYVRICKYTLGTFWKEMLFYFTQALYQRYNGYTGTSLYESWSLSMFNTLFTSLPVIFLGFFEKDLKAETLLGIPELYKYGQHNMGFNPKVFFQWIFMAISESLLIFYLMYVLYGNIAFAGSATYTTDNGIYSMGVLAFTACVIIIACKLQFWELQNKTCFAAAAMGISIGGWFLWNIILAAAYGNNYIYDVKGGILTRWGRSWLWWLSLLVIVIVVWTFELVVKMVRVTWRPSEVDEFQQMEQDKKCWEKIKAAASDQAVLGKQIVDEWEEEREREVRELLERPRVMQEDGMRRRSVRTEEEGIELEELHGKGKDPRDGFGH